MTKEIDPTYLARIALLMVTLSLLFVCGCGSKNMQLESHWARGETEIDGEWEDWDDTPLFYFEEYQASLGLRNNAQELALLLCFRDENWATMAGSGITVWLDAEGKSGKKLGIRYMGWPNEFEMPGAQSFPDSEVAGHEPGPDRMRRRERQREMAERIAIIDGISDTTVVVAADGSEGPAFAFGASGGMFAFEMRVPLEETKDGSYTLDAHPGQTVSIGLEWGGIEKQMAGPTKGKPGEGGPRGESPGEGGPPGGRGGMRPMGRGRGERPLNREIWFRAALALPDQEE